MTRDYAYIVTYYYTAQSLLNYTIVLAPVNVKPYKRETMPTKLTYLETLDKDSKEYKDRFTVKLTKPRKCTNTWGKGFVLDKALDELALSRRDRFNNTNTPKKSHKTYYGE